MSLADMFQDRVNDVRETGLELKIVFNAMGRILTVIPDDDDTVRRQCARRNELREAGEVIRVSDLYAYDFSNKEDNREKRKNQGERKELPATRHEQHHQRSHSGTPDNFGAHAADTAEQPHRTSSGIQSTSSSSSSSFVSSTLMHSDAQFPSGTSTAANGLVENNTGDAGVDAHHVNGTPSAAYIEARVVEESTLQLRIFDYNPRQWLLQFLCTATKLYTEESDTYLQALHVLLNFMSVRRRRIERRSAVLRERQQKQKQQEQSTQLVAQAKADRTTKPSSPHNATTTTPVKEARAFSAFSSVSATFAEVSKVLAGKMRPHADEREDFEEESDTDLSPEETERAAVSLPENVLRLKSTTISSFFSIYVALIMRQEIPISILKRICAEAVVLCTAQRNYPCEPVDMVEQLHRDAKEQAESFLNQWMTKGEGRLAPVMVSPPAPKKCSAAEHGQNAAERSASEESSSVYDSHRTHSRGGSTVGEESVMDSEGNLIHSTSDPYEGSARTIDEAENKRGEEGMTHAKMLAVAAAAHPPVEATTAQEMIAEHCESLSPCTSRLTQYVVDTVTGMTRTALLPCIEQPERHAFNEGYVRLAPFMTSDEEKLLTEWMQVRLTELHGTYDADRESALVRAWASPTYDAQCGELTVLVNPTNAFRMQLSNPASFSPSGMQCDMCCLGGRNVSFQAVLENGVRSEVIIGYEGCVGYDMCVACSYYYYKSCEVRLLRSVHPNAAVRRSFAYGQYSKIVVQSVKVNNCSDDREWVVEVIMGVSPFGVLPVGWVLPQDQLTALGEACPLTPNEDDYVELTAAEHAALPVPGADWQRQCQVTNVSKRLLDKDGNETLGGGSVDEDASEDDVCPICLQQLHSSLPVLRTLCGHWFHVECIGSHYHYKPAVVDGEVNEANGCPVCRCSEYMPSLTNVEETLQTNVYKLEVHVPVAAAADAATPCAVAVGTILTEDGAYHNATNVAACTAFYDLVPGFTYTAEEEAEPAPLPQRKRAS